MRQKSQAANRARIEPATACLVEDAARSRERKPRRTLSPSRWRGSAPASRKRMTPKSTVGRVEHLAAHRLGSGDARGPSAIPHVQALRPKPQDDRAARGAGQREARLVHVEHAAVGVSIEEIDRRRADEAGDEQRIGTLVEILGSALLLDPAAVHHHHPVGHRRRFDLIVGDEDRGHAEFALDAADLGAHREPQPGVEVRQRLVEQQQVRPLDQRAGERHALLLPAG